MNADINKLIFNTIVRILKDNKLYNTFRASIAVTCLSGKNGVSSIYQFYLEDLVDGNGIFADCYNYDEFIKKLEKHVSMLNANRWKKNEDEETKTQFYVMESINLILKNCIERHFDLSDKGQRKVLENLGQEMFDSICKKLFGENFEDKTVNREQLQFEFDEEKIREFFKVASKLGITSFKGGDWGTIYYDEDNISKEHTSPNQDEHSILNNDFMNYFFNINRYGRYGCNM